MLEQHRRRCLPAGVTCLDFTSGPWFWVPALNQSIRNTDSLYWVFPLLLKAFLSIFLTKSLCVLSCSRSSLPSPPPYIYRASSGHASPWKALAVQALSLPEATCAFLDEQA